jgi:hypothetical protein
MEHIRGPLAAQVVVPELALLAHGENWVARPIYIDSTNQNASLPLPEITGARNTTLLYSLVRTLSSFPRDPGF